MTTATRRQPETLALWPDEEDVELPLDEVPGEVRNELLGLESLTTDLTDALADVLDALERGRDVPANRLRRYRLLVGRPAVVDEAATPEERRDEGIARAAARWTDDEVALVDAAIRAVVDRKRADAIGDGEEGSYGYALAELTTADVWAELAGRVPVTKGIAGRMAAAKSAGLIVNTGVTRIAPRESTGPNHGQRLTVWRVA